MKLVLLSLVIACNVFAANTNVSPSWNEIRSSWKFRVLGEKISYGDENKGKVSIFDICMEGNGSLRTLVNVNYCHDSDFVDRGQKVCFDEEKKVVSFANRFEKKTCFGPQCESRETVFVSIPRTTTLSVVKKGYSLQGPFSEHLFKKQYTIPHCL